MSGESETLLRLSIFAGVLIVLAGLEVLWPRRAVPRRVTRWPVNVALSVLNSVLTRLIFLVVPGLSVLAALYGEGQGFGVLPLIRLTGFVAGLVGFILLDLPFIFNMWRFIMCRRFGWSTGCTMPIRNLM